MGNRGNVIFVNGDEISPSVYLHWNGGPESVYAFLGEMDVRGIRYEPMYEAARFTQIVGEFFDQDKYGTLSLGVANGPTEITTAALLKVQTDDGDNGFYIVDRGAGMMRRWKGYPIVELDQQNVTREKEGVGLEFALEIDKVFRDLAPGKESNGYR